MTNPSPPLASEPTAEELEFTEQVFDYANRGQLRRATQMIREHTARGVAAATAELEAVCKLALEKKGEWQDRFRAIVGQDTPDMAGNAVLDLQAKLATLERELAEAKEEQIYCFSEDEVPVYIQGYLKGAHEITELCTAEEVNNFVGRITSFRAQLAASEARCKEAGILLDVAKCPHCDGSGCIPYKTGVTDGGIEEVLPEPCEWCQRRAALTTQAKQP